MVPVQEGHDPLVYVASEVDLAQAVIYHSRYDAEHFILEGNAIDGHPRFRALRKLDYTERDIADGAPYDVSASGDGQTYYFNFCGWSAVSSLDRSVTSDDNVETADALLLSLLREEWRRDASLQAQALVASLRGLDEQERVAFVRAMQRDLNLE